MKILMYRFYKIYLLNMILLFTNMMSVNVK